MQVKYFKISFLLLQLILEDIHMKNLNKSMQAIGEMLSVIGTL